MSVVARHQPESKRIAVAERLEANGRLVALIHELAHALVAEDLDAPRLDYAQVRVRTIAVRLGVALPAATI